jgi:uncharacterized protein (DUF2252 family)
MNPSPLKVEVELSALQRLLSDEPARIQLNVSSSQTQNEINSLAKPETRTPRRLVPATWKVLLVVSAIFLASGLSYFASFSVEAQHGHQHATISTNQNSSHNMQTQNDKSISTASVRDPSVPKKKSSSINLAPTQIPSSNLNSNQTFESTTTPPSTEKPQHQTDLSTTASTMEILTSNSDSKGHVGTSVSKFHYKEVTEKERAAFIPRAMDGWNTHLNYWDRLNKNQIMHGSSFAFYRGTASLYWYDMGQDSRLHLFGGNHKNTTTWLTGDGHVYNIGSIGDDDASTSDNNALTAIYTLNDFDESVYADYQLDLWRLGVSIVLIARSNNNLGSTDMIEDDLKDILHAMSVTYLERMALFAKNKPATREVLTKDNTYGLLQQFLTIVEQKYHRVKMLDKWAPLHAHSGQRLFDLSLEKLGSVTVQEKEALLKAFDEGYWETIGENQSSARYKVVDVARRLLAGTGSLGCDRFYILVEDNTTAAAAGNSSVPVVLRILDVKEQPLPAPYLYMGKMAQSNFDDVADKGNNSAKGMAYATKQLALLKPNKFVGYLTLNSNNNNTNSKTYSVTERSPLKRSFPALKEEAVKKFKTLTMTKRQHYIDMAEQWAWVLATHHAYATRNTNTSVSLEDSVMALINTPDKQEMFCQQVQNICVEYADQVAKDWVYFKNGLGADVSASNIDD